MFGPKKNKDDLPEAVRLILTNVQDLAENFCNQAKSCISMVSPASLPCPPFQETRYLPNPGAWLAQQYSNSSYLRTLLVGTRPDERGCLVCPEYSVLVSRLEAVNQELDRKLHEAHDTACTVMTCKLGWMRLQLELKARELMCRDDSEKPVTDKDLLEALMQELSQLDYSELPAVAEYRSIRDTVYRAAIERYQAIFDEVSKANA